MLSSFSWEAYAHDRAVQWSSARHQDREGHRVWVQTSPDVRHLCRAGPTHVIWTQLSTNYVQIGRVYMNFNI